jgi:hypothetical protein
MKYEILGRKYLCLINFINPINLFKRHKSTSILGYFFIFIIKTAAQTKVCTAVFIFIFTMKNVVCVH